MQSKSKLFQCTADIIADNIEISIVMFTNQQKNRKN